MKQSSANYLPGMFDIQATTTKNHLLYGDNLTIMRNMPSMSIDLIYLDPPFNSQRNYNLIYKKLTGQPVPEQEEAFCDAWELDAEKEQMAKNMHIVLQEHGVAERGLGLLGHEVWFEGGFCGNIPIRQRRQK